MISREGYKALVCSVERGTGTPTPVDYTEKVMLKQLGAYSVSSKAMIVHNSVSDKVGDKQWKFHVLYFG
jgi:hypothetical protein